MVIFIIFVIYICKLSIQILSDFICFHIFHHISVYCRSWLNFSIIYNNIFHCMRIWIYSLINLVLHVINSDIFHCLNNKICPSILFMNLVIWCAILKSVRIQNLFPYCFMISTIYCNVRNHWRTIFPSTFSRINYTAKDLFYLIKFIRWSISCLI